MLFRSKELKGRMVAGVDEEVGKIADVFFDDERWTGRYIVVEKGGWFNSRQVLVFPSSLASEQPTGFVLKTTLTHKQIMDSPPIDTEQPVSRQYETDHAAYYGYPIYWVGSGLWETGGMPFSPEMAMPPRPPDPGSREQAARQRENQDSHLRSCDEIMGYHIQAKGGEIGRLDEYLIDPGSWQIQRIVIDTRNWLPGKHVQVDPAKISDVDWPERKVDVDMTREQIKALPEGAG